MRRSVLASCVSAIVLAGVLLAAPACAAPRGRVYVRVAPPVPVVQVRSAAPGPGYVWIGGYQRWTGVRYEWTGGRWVMPPRPRATWIPGHWQSSRRGWYWVDGHWR